MSLTSIGQTKTPSRPVEVTFAAETGTPSDAQEILLIGRKAASGSADDYKVVERFRHKITASLQQGQVSMYELLLA